MKFHDLLYHESSHLRLTKDVDHSMGRHSHHVHGDLPVCCSKNIDHFTDDVTGQTAVPESSEPCEKRVSASTTVSVT